MPGNLRKLTAQDLLDTVQVTDPQLSPDGRWVTYQARQMLLDDNSYRSDLWIVRVGEQGSGRKLTDHEANSNAYPAFQASWAPDSTTLSYFAPGAGLTLLELSEGEVTSRKSLKDLEAHFDDNANSVTAMRWSPDGRYIAFLQPLDPGGDPAAPPSSGAGDPQPPPGRTDSPHTAVRIDITKGGTIGAQTSYPPAALSLFEVKSGEVETLTDPSLDIKDLDWSPDSQRLVISALRGDTRSHYLEADLYTVGVESHTVTPLLQQAGGDTGPVWSPDGKSIAFWSQMGSDDWGWTYLATPAVIPADGGEPRYLIENLLEEFVFSKRYLFWSDDSAAIYVEQPHQLTNRLFRIPLTGGTLERVTPDDDVYRSEFSFSPSTGAVAFTEQSLTSPPDVFVSTLSEFRATRVTDANPWTAERAWPQMRRFEWKSRDGQYDIPGYALLPPDYDAAQRYPLSVEVVGGPSVSSMKFFVWNPFPNLLFATEGYVHFVPNTRGRSGGAGRAFALAIREGGSFLRNGLEDVLAGVDLMVEQGIADPERLAIMGHSYGGGMTATALVHSDRFTAAAFHEGVTDFVYHLFKAAGDPVFRKHQADQGAMGPPYEEEHLARAVRESPIYHARNANTPTLIEAGELALHEHATLLANALHYFGVPYDFFLYPRTGHVTLEPQLVQDELRRKLEWFGYWIKGQPYSDMAKQAEFDQWSSAAGSTGRGPDAMIPASRPAAGLRRGGGSL